MGDPRQRYFRAWMDDDLYLWFVVQEKRRRLTRYRLLKALREIAEKHPAELDDLSRSAPKIRPFE